jgi:hypothetical protein
MLTPEISLEMAKSATVTCRAHPPFWIRFGALLKEAHGVEIALREIGCPEPDFAGPDR